MAKEYLEQLTAFIKQATAGRFEGVQLECKHFFSGAALYADGRICISLTPVGLAIKLPEETREKLLANKKAIPLRYFPKGPIKKDYALFPDGLATDKRTINKQVRDSITYALALPKPKVKKKRTI